MLDLLLPRRCAVCSKAGDGLCPACVDTLPAALDEDPPQGLDDLVALWSYEGPTRALIQSFKYRNHRDALDKVGTALGIMALDEYAATVSWAPTSAGRRRRRGFDQAELLARRAAAVSRLPCRSLLRRLPGPGQTGLDRAERWAGPRFTTRPLVPHSVVLVDDVSTTGATLSAAARALTDAGAERVVGLVVAVRPLFAGRQRLGAHPQNPVQERR